MMILSWKNPFGFHDLYKNISALYGLNEELHLAGVNILYTAEQRQIITFQCVVFFCTTVYEKRDAALTKNF